MKLSEVFDNVKTVGITGHVRPDGDCTGSTSGLYNYLKQNMPQLDVDWYLEKPGQEFGYIPCIDEVKTAPLPGKKYDVFFVLDCGAKDRITPFVELFEQAEKTICIDHHISTGDFADVNLVVPDASSTCEVLYSTLDEEKVTTEVATCIYTGIIHDTGVFKYSCTSAKTMTIAGKLMEKGIEYSDIIDNSFYKKTYIQNQILGRALLESVLFYDKKCIFSSVTREEMDFYNVTGRELGGIIEQLRLTEGVEVAIFLYEVGTNEFKVSLRSKKIIDVSKIAMQFGGGGHIRAAGFTAKGTVYSIINRVGEMIENQYNAVN